ncbi:MAG: hypothetical protein ACOX8B_03380 [Lachnospiraceae bacterium]|jgi:hypothetical protein
MAGKQNGRRQDSNLGYGRKDVSAAGVVSLVLFGAEAALLAASIGLSISAGGNAGTLVGFFGFAVFAMSVVGLVLAAAGLKNPDTRHGTAAAGLAANAAVLAVICVIFVSGV